MEHAQLILFLFHSLQLMQKKSILLLCAQTLIRAAQAAFSIIPLHDTQLMLLARILILLEYLIKNLYDASATMLEQIQFNLLSSTGLANKASGEDASAAASATPAASRIYSCCRELEDSFRRFGLEEEGGCCIRPRFYLLSNADGSAPGGASGGNNQDRHSMVRSLTSSMLYTSASFTASVKTSVTTVLFVPFSTASVPDGGSFSAFHPQCQSWKPCRPLE